MEKFKATEHDPTLEAALEEEKVWGAMSQCLQSFNLKESVYAVLWRICLPLHAPGVGPHANHALVDDLIDAHAMLV